MLVPFREPESVESDLLPDHPEEELPGSTERDRKRARKAVHERLLRREKIQRVAEAAAEQWLRFHVVEAGVPRSAGRQAPVLHTLPHPKGIEVARDREPALPPPRREVTFKARLLRSAGRLAVWVWGASRFFAGVLWDKLRRRDSEERRAVRLRQTFEAMGTTFIKVGQQLSMRLDLLPYAYTRELENMLDSVRAIPLKDAISAIERATGRPLDQTFQAFDPEPIGSASVACVYQAFLISGERVAVKVRRPGIGELLAADMRAFGWLLAFVELFYFRPGFTANLAFELRTMLMEELDFVREARFNELFRRRMRKTRQLRFATAPKIFFDYSNAEVLVAEFISAISLTDMLAALETQDAQALARLVEMKIDPVILARRIQLIARFNNFENIFFHADLHPANVLIQPGNKIVLIDFGSCGSFSRKELISWRRWFDAQSINDVGGMVQAALAIIEPLPPIDRDTFALRMESMFWTDLYAIKSKHSVWSERISARLWMGFLKLSREFEVPMRLNTLRMIRASMLADTIAARLDHDQDPYKEFRFYEKGAGRRAKSRTLKRLRRLKGPSKFIRIENGIEGALKFFYRVQRAVDSLASIGIIPLIGRVTEAIQLILRGIMTIVGMAGTWVMAVLVYRYIANKVHPTIPVPHIAAVIQDVLENGWFWLLALGPVLIMIRKIHSRLGDRDYEPPSGDSSGIL